MTVTTHIAGPGAKGRVRALRRRALLAIAAGTAALLLVTIFSVSSFGGADLASAAIQRAKSFLELIEQRSPGKRTTAHLTKVKRKRVTLHERALPKIRPPALPSMPPMQPPLIDIVAPPVPVVPASLEVAPIPLFKTPAILQPGIPFSPPPGVIVPPFIAAATPTPPPPIPPPASAVPEPATWAAMLIGFALICGRLRARRLMRKGLRSN